MRSEFSLLQDVEVVPRSHGAVDEVRSAGHERRLSISHAMPSGAAPPGAGLLGPFMHAGAIGGGIAGARAWAQTRYARCGRAATGCCRSARGASARRWRPRAAPWRAGAPAAGLGGTAPLGRARALRSGFGVPLSAA